MAHFLRHQSFISTSVRKHPRLHHQTNAPIKLPNHGKKRAKGNGCLVQCSTSSYSSSMSSAKASVELSGKAEEDNNGRWEDKEEQQPLYLASENGWKVRRLEENQYETRKVAQIQAEAFHQPMPLFDDLFFRFFKAEVLAGLMYKLRNSPPTRYACLVAESPSDAKLVGVVDVTALRDNDVLRHLHGTEEYLYVSGLAVSKCFRRRKIGSCLLKACEVLSVLWGFKYLVLRAYEDDSGARTLYANAGYRVVSGDPPWTTSWIGRRRRVLMIKQCNFIDLISSTFQS
ncbi:Acyl-CoA N-acyltransferases superfamily protein, putative isoform 2 [Hibiscus syriacus]|uniref:Acyl-CoA N-acyltransferases superfamily protein, putative isoform 2 n=1 Tax=Hibiscus syriacus TaxID=106335 RepID=A0A6A2Y240_HIBSY|nr:uncharacterized protein LOC120164209 [Hibiscus syriacus]KAE8677520.1 Acyl-CoA N-acyltransferases superfamily protein, putative isoform 2 [Hibiscus syriacus]